MSVDRVLITGGCGFIGSHLTRYLIERGHHVTVLDDLSSGHRDHLPAENGQLRIIVGSVLDRGSIRDSARDSSLVFHLASVVGMELVTRIPDVTYHVSISGTRNVLDETGDVPVVLLSSSCVYGHGPSVDRPIPRELALGYDGGTAGYATGKWELEALGHQAAQHGRQVLVVRPFNVIGPRQSHLHGMVVPRFVRAALRDEPLLIYGDGTQRRAFTYVQDFVDTLVRLARSGGAERPLDLGAPSSTSILELARTVIEVTGSRSPIEHEAYARRFPGRIDVVTRVPDVSRAEDRLGPIAWTPLPAIIASCARSLGTS